MTPRSPRRMLSRPLRRRLIPALAGAVLALSFAAAPAAATVALRDHYSDDYAFSFDDCGFWIDVSGHTEGTFHVRVGKGELTSAFFAHDNYSFLETWTRRDNGDSFTLGGNGLFQETTATHISGTIFEFTGVNAGQPFIVWDADGNIILRDRGVIRAVIQFDTLGDGVPGGEFVADVSLSVSGPHPGFGFDLCTLLD